MTDPSTDLSPQNASARIEALLFVATSPVTASQLADCLGLTAEEVEREIDFLKNRLSDHGITVQQFGGRYQLTTAAELASDVEKFLGLEITTRLSRAAVETMAIIAYRQPITRPGIEAIRGVSSDGVIRSLLSRGLIQEVGRADSPGRPILFSTTSDFLQHFGLNSLDQLPPYENEQEDEPKPKNGLLKD